MNNLLIYALILTASLSSLKAEVYNKKAEEIQIKSGKYLPCRMHETIRMEAANACHEQNLESLLNGKDYKEEL